MAKYCDTQLIEKCARYANDAYTNTIKGTFIEDIKTDCQSFVILNEDEDEVIITGQGSTTMKDWLIDFQIWRKKVPYLENTLVHSGFIKQYESVRLMIHKEIDRHISKGKIKRIICTGHSLFGAISTIIALDCAIKYPVQVSCVSFGSPRVGSRKFAKIFNKLVATSFRCIRHKDPIVFTPLPGRFKHVRGGVHFGKDISFKIPFYNPIGCRISHHSMEDYLHFISTLNEMKIKTNNNLEPSNNDQSEVTSVNISGEESIKFDD